MVFIFIHVFQEIAANFFVAIGILQNRMDRVGKILRILCLRGIFRWMEALFIPDGQFILIFLYPVLIQFMVNGADSFQMNHQPADDRADGGGVVITGIHTEKKIHI